MPQASSTLSKAAAKVPLKLSVLVVLVVLNVFGILLLFLKAELDTQQIRNEIGLVWREGQLTYVTQNQCAQETQNIEAQQDAAARGSSEEFYAAHAWGVYTHNFTSKPIQIDEGIRRILGRVFSSSVNFICDPATESACDPTTKTMAQTVDLYSVAAWSAPGDHVFYIRVPGVGGPKWYGPFVDDIVRLQQEAEQQQ